MGDYDWPPTVQHELKKQQRVDWQKKALEALLPLAVFTAVVLFSAVGNA